MEEAGRVNLYLLAWWRAPVFIATLSEADGSEVRTDQLDRLRYADEGDYLVIGSRVWGIVRRR